MKYAAIIQARFGASRLPGKVLIDLNGKPVLQRIVERVQKSKHVDEVFVVTSIEKNNLPILRLCADLGVRTFAGSENDVLDRYYQLAKLLQPEYVIRITADCPFYDWTILDSAIDSMKPETDYLSDFNETLPDGFDIEIMRYTALEVAWHKASLASEREHVTQFIRKNPKQFNLQNFLCPYGDYGHLRLTLDEEADLMLIQKISTHFYTQKKDDFLLSDIINFLKEKPELTKLNAHIARNEGLAKSLTEDRKV